MGRMRGFDGCFLGDLKGDWVWGWIEVYFKNIIKYYSIEVLHLGLIEVVCFLLRVPRLRLKILEFMRDVGGKGAREHPLMRPGVVG